MGYAEGPRTRSTLKSQKVGPSSAISAVTSGWAGDGGEVRGVQSRSGAAAPKGVGAPPRGVVAVYSRFQDGPGRGGERCE